MSAVSEGNWAIEIHDSTLESIERNGSTLVAVLSAYLHSSAGSPGASPGSGWSQTAHIEIGDGNDNGVGTPVGLIGGKVDLGDEVRDNLIPIPLTHEGPVRVELETAKGETVVLAGNGLRVVLLGSAVHIEEFPGE